MTQVAISAAYESAKDRLGRMSLAEFAETLRDAEVVPVMVDGKCAGAVVVSGPEIHACVLPWAHGRWMSKKFLALMAQVMADHGRVITSATTEMGEQFVKRLGFERLGAYWVKHGH